LITIRSRFEDFSNTSIALSSLDTKMRRRFRAEQRCT